MPLVLWCVLCVSGRDGVEATGLSEAHRARPLLTSLRAIVVRASRAVVACVLARAVSRLYATARWCGRGTRLTSTHAATRFVTALVLFVGRTAVCAAARYGSHSARWPSLSSARSRRTRPRRSSWGPARRWVELGRRTSGSHLFKQPTESRTGARLGSEASYGYGARDAETMAGVFAAFEAGFTTMFTLEVPRSPPPRNPAIATL